MICTLLTRGGLFLALCLALTLAAGAAEGKVNPALSDDDDAFLNRQAAALLGQVEQTLRHVPPRLPEPRERRLALLVMDGVLHEAYAANRPPVQEFFHAQMSKAIGEMERAKVTEGALIWKLYNHGFVVRTPTVTLAFDLNPGTRGFRVDDAAGQRVAVPSPGFPISDALVERLVSQCDVLFISHAHGDHANETVAQAFLDQGKPVVGPPEGFIGTPLEHRITQLRREAHTVQSLPIQQGRRQLSVVVYPGQQYQGHGVPNNVVLVITPEGLAFAHNGDQINDPYPEYQADYAWIDKVHEHHRVDVLMTNCWTDDIYRQVRGFDPKLVILGHENELGHQLWDRVPYWGDSEYLKLSLPQLLASQYPVLSMTWGERYHYRRR